MMQAGPKRIDDEAAGHDDGGFGELVVVIDVAHDFPEATGERRFDLRDAVVELCCRVRGREETEIVRFQCDAGAFERDATLKRCGRETVKEIERVAIGSDFVGGHVSSSRRNCG